MPIYSNNPIGKTIKPSGISRKGRLRQQRRNALLHQLKGLDATVQQFVDVSPDWLLAQAQLTTKLQHEQLDLAAEIYSIDPDFAEFEMTTCPKSGMPISEIPPHIIAQTVQTHGRARAKTLLKYSQLGHTHPAWLETSPKARDSLMSANPTAYFCFAAKQLSERFDAIQPQHARQPNADEALELKWQAHLELRRLHKRVSDAGVSWEQLTEANKLLSHFLGLCKPRHPSMKKIGGVYVIALLKRYSLLTDGPESDFPAHFDKLVEFTRQAIRQVLEGWREHNIGRITDKQKKALRKPMNAKQLEWMRKELAGSLAMAKTKASDKQRNVFASQLEHIELIDADAKKREDDNKYLRMAQNQPRNRIVIQATKDDFLDELPSKSSMHGNKRVFEGESHDASERVFSFSSVSTSVNKKD